MMAYYEDIVETYGDTLSCILCSVPLDNNNKVIDYHLNEENHKKLYFRRMMILNNIQNSYCNLCNCSMMDLNHINNSKHKKQLLQIHSLVEEDGAFIEVPSNILQSWTSGEQGTNSHCTLCNQHVDFTVKEIQNHIQSQKHTRSKAMALQPFNGIFSVEGSNKDLWCKICQRYFANYIEKIFEHVDDSEHYVKLNKIIRLIEGQNITIDNYLTNATEDKATCNKCKTQVSCNVDNLERHIKGKRHKNA